MQYAMCINSKYLQIEIISEDIKNTSENKFRNILNEGRLLNICVKREEQKYSEIRMADYSMPNNENMTLSDQRYIFSIRNRMAWIPANFPLKDKNLKFSCICGEREENMEHVYLCEKWVTERLDISYEMIYSDNLVQMMQTG